MCAGLFGDVLTCGLRGVGRRDWEVGLRYGVRMNHMITFESIEFFFSTYIIPHTFILIALLFLIFGAPIIFSPTVNLLNQTIVLQFGFIISQITFLLFLKCIFFL